MDCGAAYRDAPEHIKRMFNQAFFSKVLVIQDDQGFGNVRLEAEFREPFDTLLGRELKRAVSARQAPQTPKKTTKGSRKADPSGLFQDNSFSNRLLVEVRGFEPLTPCMPCKCSAS